PLDRAHGVAERLRDRRRVRPGGQQPEDLAATRVEPDLLRVRRRRPAYVDLEAGGGRPYRRQQLVARQARPGKDRRDAISLCAARTFGQVVRADDEGAFLPSLTEGSSRHDGDV